MLTSAIQEKIAAWNTERDEIQNRIAALNSEKREAAVAVQAALKEKNIDGIIAARQVAAQLDQEIEALKMIAVEVAKVPPVDHNTFTQEYAEFFAHHIQTLDKAHAVLATRLTELESLYLTYEAAHGRYVAELKSWQDLAAKIGVDRPTELRNQILNPAHGDIKRAVSKLRVTGGF